MAGLLQRLGNLLLEDVPRAGRFSSHHVFIRSAAARASGVKRSFIGGREARRGLRRRRSWLPFGFGIVLGAGITTKILTKVAPLGRDPSYAAHILPAIFLTAFGFAMGFVPLPLTAVDGVRAEESGIASALLNASQQIGVALALALLSTIAITATDARLPRALDALHEGREARDPVLIEAASDALIHGYGSGLAAGAVAIAVAALLAAVLITTRRPTGGVRPGLH